VLNGYVTNPNHTPTLTPNPNRNPDSNLNRINKKIIKKPTLENRTINDFPKTNKMAERYFKHKCEMKLPYEGLDENTNKSTKFCFNKRTK
jgi:hypothetical protein